jgi:hypothetical protein
MNSVFAVQIESKLCLSKDVLSGRFQRDKPDPFLNLAESVESVR